METLKQKDIQEEIRSVLSRERAIERREQRELRKAEITGRVSSFLRNRANSNETLRASLAIVEAKTPLDIAQATVQYQQVLGSTQRSIPLATNQNQIPQQPFTPIPPIPDDNQLYVLTVEEGLLAWTQVPKPPEDNQLYVLTTQNESLEWTQTEECETQNN